MRGSGLSSAHLNMNTIWSALFRLMHVSEPSSSAGGEDHKTGSLWPYDPYDRWALCSALCCAMLCHDVSRCTAPITVPCKFTAVQDACDTGNSVERSSSCPSPLLPYQAGEVCPRTLDRHHTDRA